MRHRRLLWRIFWPCLVVTLVSVAAVAWYASRQWGASHRRELAHALAAQARLFANQVLVPLSSGEHGQVDALCKEVGKAVGARFTVLLDDGTVVGDSEGEPAQMENHSLRPEVRAALAGKVGVALRHSTTVERDMCYVAIPLLREEQVVGAVRAALPVAGLRRAQRAFYLRLAWAGLVIAALAAGTSLVVARRISQPLEEMTRGAQRFARGDFARRIPPADIEELDQLAQVLNEMSAQLDARVRAVLQERHEREAILSSMVEAVVAVDDRERVLHMNQAAAIFAVDVAGAVGRPLQEVILNLDLESLMRRALASDAPVEGDVALYAAGDERQLQAHAAPLRDGRGQRIGAVIVLNDVTRLRRLERMRREFVANVSHELKTPITSIKGFVETLLSGALDNPTEARRFLQIIARHTDRLNAIIEDLLSLSRLEEETERQEVILKEGDVGPVIEAAVAACAAKAAAKNIAIERSIAAGLRVRLNARLLEQAVINLLDNAIKYSPAGARVRVEASTENAEVVIRVRDEGCGIEARHLPRLFERFYRVDKARSRANGGTGLGLAIVKHIAQAHGGYPTVSSTPGKGSIFAIHLPCLPA